MAIRTRPPTNGPATCATHFQEKFGDGGSGFSLAGRPWNSYRRMDVRSGSTRGWHTDGLVGRAGDGVYGLGGVSLSTTSAHEAVYLDANAAEFELFYYQQPGGGTLQIYDNGTPMEQISTDGEPGPAYYRLEAIPGMHRVEAETLDRGPVRLFGWVAENTTGVTYEELGINGAEASIVLGWNEETLRSNIERRNPALIVLAYGTNEAGRKDWTLESYREMYSQLIARLRADAPTATILVVGPPDRTQKIRKVGWQTMEKDRRDRRGAERSGAGQRLRVLGSAGQDGRQGFDAEVGGRRHGAGRSRALHRARVPDAGRRRVPRRDEPVRYFPAGARRDRGERNISSFRCARPLETNDRGCGRSAAGQIVSGDLYCPRCQQEVKDPLICGDCLSTICRQCGTPLEQVDELGIG